MIKSRAKSPVRKYADGGKKKKPTTGQKVGQVVDTGIYMAKKGAKKLAEVSNKVNKAALGSMAANSANLLVPGLGTLLSMQNKPKSNYKEFTNSRGTKTQVYTSPKTGKKTIKVTTVGPGKTKTQVLPGGAIYKSTPNERKTTTKVVSDKGTFVKYDKPSKSTVPNSRYTTQGNTGKKGATGGAKAAADAIKKKALDKKFTETKKSTPAKKSTSDIMYLPIRKAEALPNAAISKEIMRTTPEKMMSDMGMKKGLKDRVKGAVANFKANKVKRLQNKLDKAKGTTTMKKGGTKKSATMYKKGGMKC